MDKSMKTNPKTVDEAMTMCHRMVCKQVHNAIRNHKQDFDDAYQIAAMGVTRAFNEFDHTKSNAAFTTVAYKYIFQHLMDHYKRREYTRMNNTAFKSIDDYTESFATVSDIDEKIEFDQILSKMDTTTKIITIMRSQGYTYDEIATQLNKCAGNSYTLHQVRNKHLKALDMAMAA